MLHKIFKYGTVFVVVLCLAITPLSVSASSISENDSPLYTMDYFNCKFLNPSISLYNTNGSFYSDLDFDCWFSLAPGNYELGLETDKLYPSINSSGGVSNKVFVFKFQILLPFSDYGQNFSFRVNSAGFDDDFDLLNNSLSYIYSSGSEDIIEGTVTELNDKLTYSISDVPGGSLLFVSVPFNYLYSSSSLFEFYFDTFSLNSTNVLSSVNGEIYDLLIYISSNTGSSAESLADILALIEFYESYLESIDDQTYDILNQLGSYLPEIDSFLDDIYSNTSSTKTFLYIELLNYLEWFDTYFADIEVSSASIDYFLWNDFSNYLATYLELFENYFYLQEDLITQPPASSSDLSDSIQSNPPREDGKDIVGELDSAQNEALGGKTPEDVKQDIEDTLDSDKLKEDISEEDEIEFEEIELEDITIVNQNVFNVVFDAFGGKWASYVVLTLSLAFAAFVIGRRF